MHTNFDLEPLIRPKAVAVIGASTSPNKPGGTPVALLTRLGYAGTIVPVHPQATEIQGLAAVRSILDAPLPIDLAIVAVPAESAVQVMREAAQAQVRAVVMFTSGFAETGDDGALRQAEIAAIARDAGIALLGPNCLGVMSLRRRLFATFSPAPLAGQPPAGSVGLVSQSGAFGAYAFSLARKAGLGLSHWVTTGNEASSVPVVPHLVAGSGKQAAAAAQALNGPVAVKLLSRDVLHKSDVGGVRLNVRSPDDAARAFDEIVASAARLAPGTRIDAICRVGELAAAAGGRLQTIEVNPLMVTTDGVFAADAVVQWQAVGSDPEERG